jgi:hypothetical protein
MEFDPTEVEKLGMLGATAPEMAAWFGCGLRTIERRMAKVDGEFWRAYEKGFGRLKISLRRQQIESAKGGSVAMLIWLGKQLLGQADKHEVKPDPSLAGKTATMALSPKDEEFLRRKSEIVKQGTI